MVGGIINTSDTDELGVIYEEKGMNTEDIVPDKIATWFVKLSFSAVILKAEGDNVKQSS